MSLEDLGNIGEFVAAIGVIVSLIYLAVQIRQNTRAVRGTFHDSSVSRTQAWQLAIASDPELSEILSRAQRGDELTDQERFRNGFLRRYVLVGSEGVYHQYRRGNVDSEVWETQLARLRIMLANPRFRDWWRDERRLPLTESFQQLIDEELTRIGGEG